MSGVETILLIEDEVNLVAILKEMFEENNIRVLVAQSRNEALLKVRNQRYDCIISDIKLKATDSVPVLEEMLNNPRCLNKGVPLIIYSGHIDPEVIKNYKKVISAAYVKPTDTMELIQKVKELMSSKSSGTISV